MMGNIISGLHHITGIAGDPQRNHDFYTQTLGLRMVKQTVNFDDPQTYHLYYGDEVGTPGTILTFFPWPGARHGKKGAGMATETGYAVPKGSLSFWKKRFEDHGVTHDRIHERFGEKYLPFRDPDGLWLSLTEPEIPDNRKGWEIPGITKEEAIKGFHSVTLTLNSISKTADLLTSVFDYSLQGKEGNISRYRTETSQEAAIIDLLEMPGASRGVSAAGTIHHVAFRVKDRQQQMDVRQKVLEKGLHATGQIDRDYFFSVYFREPGGVLFEIATESPGFMIDETREQLGTSLQLPDRYEPMRERIEQVLPELKTEKKPHAQ